MLPSGVVDAPYEMTAAPRLDAASLRLLWAPTQSRRLAPGGRAMQSDCGKDSIRIIRRVNRLCGREMGGRPPPGPCPPRAAPAPSAAKLKPRVPQVLTRARAATKRTRLSPYRVRAAGVLLEIACLGRAVITAQRRADRGCRG
jgi:hypothetical protein